MSGGPRLSDNRDENRDQLLTLLEEALQSAGLEQLVVSDSPEPEARLAGFAKRHTHPIGEIILRRCTVGLLGVRPDRAAAPRELP